MTSFCRGKKGFFEPVQMSFNEVGGGGYRDTSDKFLYRVFPTMEGRTGRKKKHRNFWPWKMNRSSSDGDFSRTCKRKWWKDFEL